MWHRLLMGIEVEIAHPSVFLLLTLFIGTLLFNSIRRWRRCNATAFGRVVRCEEDSDGDVFYDIVFTTHEGKEAQHRTRAPEIIDGVARVMYDPAKPERAYSSWSSLRSEMIIQTIVLLGSIAGLIFNDWSYDALPRPTGGID